MIEVFKTTVHSKAYAQQLVDHIHQLYEGYEANFDLDDCDRILRVKTDSGTIKSDLLIQLINSYGFHASLLDDEVLTTKTN